MYSEAWEDTTDIVLRTGSSDCYLKGKMIFLVIKRAIGKSHCQNKDKYLVYMKDSDQYAL